MIVDYTYEEKILNDEADAQILSNEEEIGDENEAVISRDGPGCKVMKINNMFDSNHRGVGIRTSNATFSGTQGVPNLNIQSPSKQLLFKDSMKKVQNEVEKNIKNS